MITAKEFEAIARRMRPQLLRTACGVLADSTAAEDVVQDVMLKLWTMRSDLDRYRSIEALGCVIAHRYALNALRTQPQGRFVELSEAAATTGSAEDEFVRRERQERVDAVLASLPEAQQTLIRLRHVEGYDCAAIANLLGSTEGAVRTALCRARRRVAAVFGVHSPL
ncbi:MAG: sigma-70 family RNA polymerase sigma factor [Roseburia sp.]|nr:sigma-70 family RNA polymerase sigma factor [Roseburia sp.]